jgi:hypothetical protein
VTKNQVHRCLSGASMTELDMALMRRFEETAIILGECPLLTALLVAG